MHSPRLSHMQKNHQSHNKSSLLSFFYISFSLSFCVIYYYAPFYKFENLIALKYRLAEISGGNVLCINGHAIPPYK